MESKELGELSMLSPWELVSAWINGDLDSEPGLREGLKAEFALRGLPLPKEGPPRAAKPTGPAPMSREVFLDYLLLIYTVTGIFYAWLYLPMRLIKGDFGRDRRHRLIQAAIALGYQGAEIGTYFLLEGLVA